MKMLFLVKLLTAFCVSVWGQDTLRIASWNIQMLPNFFAQLSPSLRKMQSVRQPWIVDYVKDKNFDVIVFQEVFDIQMRKRLRRQLRQLYPYQVSTKGKFWRFTNNGILIVSKLKMRYIDHVIYEKGIYADGLASKGCTIVEVEKNGKKLQIAGTHLQSGQHDDAQHVRHKQYKNIFHLLHKHRKQEVPQFVIGDMNTEKHIPERYVAMLENLDMQDMPIQEENPHTVDSHNYWNPNEKPAQIDYILYNPNKTKTCIFRQKIFRPKRAHKGKDIDLADHYGISAEVILE